MKYGIKKSYGDETRLTNVVEVPTPLPNWAEDDQAWLAKQFPNLTGWVQVPDDAQSGAVDNGDDTFTNPNQPVVLIESDSIGRDLVMGDFIKIGYAIGIDGDIDTALKDMPSLNILLLQYQTDPGIKFADATTPGTTLATAFAKLKAAALIDDDTITDFLAKWVELYPALVPES